MPEAGDIKSSAWPRHGGRSIEPGPVGADGVNKGGSGKVAVTAKRN